MSAFARTLGVLTAGYGAAVLAKPEVLARPCELLDTAGRVPTHAAVLARCLGARDLAGGLAMVFAPSPKALRAVIAVRTASDLADAIFIGATRSNPETRNKVMAVAGTWAGLTALSALGRKGAR